MGSGLGREPCPCIVAPARRVLELGPTNHRTAGRLGPKSLAARAVRRARNHGRLFAARGVGIYIGAALLSQVSVDESAFFASFASFASKRLMEVQHASLCAVAPRLLPRDSVRRRDDTAGL